MRSIRLGMTTCLLVLALLFAGCGGDDSDESGEPAEPQATETTPTSSTTSTTVPIPQDAVALGELQIVGVQFGDSGFVRIQNRGSADANVNGIYICQFPQYTDLGTEVTGGVIDAGATVEVPASAVGGLSAEGGEAALYANNSRLRVTGQYFGIRAVGDRRRSSRGSHRSQHLGRTRCFGHSRSRL